MINAPLNYRTYNTNRDQSTIYKSVYIIHRHVLRIDIILCAIRWNEARVLSWIWCVNSTNDCQILAQWVRLVGMSINQWTIRYTPEQWQQWSMRMRRMKPYKRCSVSQTVCYNLPRERDVKSNTDPGNLVVLLTGNR